MIRALIFDFDGLILDTEVPDFQAWQEIYREHGAELTLDTWAQVIGRGWDTFDPVRHLEVEVGRTMDRETVLREHREREAELISGQPILPGVVDYLVEAKRRRLKLAVASSSRHEWVDGHLTRLGLFERFDAIRCADDVADTKPAPDLFEAALAALNVKPDEAVVFEDSPNGVTAASAAGILCVAIPNALTRQLPLDHADLVVESLAILPLSQLLSQLDGQASA